MKVLCIALAALFASTSPAVAAPTQTTRPANSEVCVTQRAGIDRAVREMAYIEMVNLADSSAPRATVAQLQVSNLYAEVQARLAVLSEGDCGPYAGPLSSSAYTEAAAGCILARRNAAGPSREHSECVRANWTAAPER